MIITKLRIQEEHPMQGAATWPQPTCDLNLNYTDGPNGYTLKEETGLGPPDFKAVVIGFDNTGIPIKDSIPDKRLISLKIALVPQHGQTYGSLRDALYKLIGRSVYVKLMDGADVICQTTGYIQKIDPFHMTNRPELIVIIECEDGVFSGPDAVSIPTASFTGQTVPIFNYMDGTAPAGFELSFQNTTGVSKTGFSITGHSEFWHAGSGDVNNTFQIVYPIDNLDIITINTHPKVRSIMMHDNSTGFDIDLSGYLNAGAVWPVFYPGVNTFTWDLNWVTTWVLARYIPRYWGV